MKFGIYTEIDTLELVEIIEANDYEEARTIARKLGYGKNYRIESEE
jgi:hypothetical protein